MNDISPLFTTIQIYFTHLHLSEKITLFYFAVLSDISPEFHTKYDTDSRNLRHGVGDHLFICLWIIR